jgi:predicted transcriptional regulator
MPRRSLAARAFRALRDRILQLAEPRPDDEAVDVGAGTGPTAVPVVLGGAWAACDTAAAVRAVSDLKPISGELQAQIMAVLWRLGSGTVEQVRSALPPRYRGAYTTAQTVLNRLAERRLLTRRKDGNVVVYRPRVSEADYVSRSIEQTLATASADARQAALARLIGDLDAGELSELQDMARELESKRGRRRR